MLVLEGVRPLVFEVRGSRGWKTGQGAPTDLHLCQRPRHGGALLSSAEVPGKKPYCSSRDRKTFCAFDQRDLIRTGREGEAAPPFLSLK